MIPRLLPPDIRALNRRRWSFRFSGLTFITVTAVEVWKLTPDEWHPVLPEWSKYVVMGVATLLAVLAAISHQIQQPSAQPTPRPVTIPPDRPQPGEPPCT